MERRAFDGQEKSVNLLLDSGAFSAWKSGKDIDIDEYIAFIKANLAYVDNYVVLDMIPGKPGIPKTQAQIDESANRSYKNFQYMKRRGLSPIPVFHQGEGFKWLERYVKEKVPYIGISPAADKQKGEIRIWLDTVFTMLTDKKGNPTVKTHGFGVASFELLKRYPWYSCDATSWALTAAYGSILVPVYRNGKPDYSEAPIKLTVSEQGRKDGSLAADHYLRMGPLMKVRVEHFLMKEVGVSVKKAAADYKVRAQAIVYFFKRFEQAIGEQPFRFRRRDFLL